MDKIALVKETIEKETGIIFQPAPTIDGLEVALAAYINDLILNNFEKLVYLLYRIDISETRIKELLQAASTIPAGEIIAKTIIERQLQKITLRQTYTPPSAADCDEEKW